jgi:hypothetical protein
MFIASLDKVAKLTPVVMIFFSVAIVLISLFADVNSFKFVLLFPSILILSIVYVCYLYQPIGYTLEADSLHINRRIGKYTISRNSIEKVFPLTTEELGFSWRIAGNGGVFGYTGWYSSGKMGKMRWFVSQRKNYVMIQTNDIKKYLLSPDDVEGFLLASK